MKIRKIYIEDDDFLAGLKNYEDMPESVYVKGGLPRGERPKVVAIVGSRKNTSYGEAVAYQLAYDLACQGVVVVSGLAYGIDAAAHRGCIDAGGVTVAVLGTPIEEVYPRQNLRLAEQILEKGAVLSEYDRRSKWGSWSFVQRNRIVSGLADAVVIVEAAMKSGTLTTAGWALEQGKELFAVPGDITRAMSVGCNKVIKQGAHVFTEVEDVLGVLWPKKARQLKFEVFGDSDEETAVIEALKEGVCDGEEIMLRANLSVRDFNRTVTMLEIKGVVRGFGGNVWRLV